MSRSYKIEKPKQNWEYRSSVARAGIEQNAQVFEDRKKSAERDACRNFKSQLHED
jgi:hypothetical protein